ncbi:MAG: signal peptide peptidase SppA [Planctomycetes bacterium]|nr:signal peptide peptidase SppA [Planctomycetota bacterium]
MAEMPPPLPPSLPSPPSLTAREVRGPAAAPTPAPAPVVQVVERRAGFGRSVAAFITSIGALGAVFVLGIGATLVLMVILGVWIGGSSYDEFVLWRTQRNAGSRQVAVIPVRGVIDGAQVSFVRACVDQVLAASSVEAVVLRVDSPGGGVTSADQIWYELGRLEKRSLPVVASFGGVAASGGYYIACDSDFIMAERTTVTGSIGVIAQILTLEGLMDKVGIEPVTLVASRSPRKNVANDTFREWTEEDRAQIIGMLDNAYEIFHERVQTGRASVITDATRLAEVADGSVFTAAQALDVGLVDGIGYLDDALAEAEKRAGIPNGRATIRSLQRRPTFFEGLPLVRANRPRALDLPDADSIRSLINELGSVRLMYLMQ